MDRVSHFSLKVPETVYPEEVADTLTLGAAAAGVATGFAVGASSLDQGVPYIHFVMAAAPVQQGVLGLLRRFHIHQFGSCRSWGCVRRAVAGVVGEA